MRVSSRRLEKKDCNKALDSDAMSPPCTPVWWFSRVSANRSITEPAAPVLGSAAPNTTRSRRACSIAPAHMAQGSSVTYSVQPSSR